MISVAADFYKYFPSFQELDIPNTTVDDRVNFWIPIAVTQVDTIFQQLQDLATCLWIAHYLTFEFKDEQDGQANLVPGATKGILRSVKAGETVSNWDINAVLMQEDGHWNTTSYGRRYIELCKMFGAGPTNASPGPFISTIPFPFNPYIG